MGNRVKTTPMNVLLTALLATGAAGLAAQETPATPANPDDPSRETDVSEDNYRRYMELKDPRLDRPSFPTVQYRPPSSLEKMAQLPESSQKHLRNQLRGIILQSGPWTPDAREQEFRFSPSEAARKDGELLQAEAEAWAELVGEYHEREAASLAARMGDGTEPPPAQGVNGTGEPSVPGAQGGSPDQLSQQQAGAPNGAEGTAGSAQQSGSPEGAGQQASGQGGNQGEGANDASDRASASSEAAGRQQPQADQWQDPQSDPSAEMSTEGVAQSASDFLRQQGIAGEANPALPDRQSPAGQSEDAGRWGKDVTRTLGSVDANRAAEPPNAARLTNEPSGSQNAMSDAAGSSERSGESGVSGNPQDVDIDAGSDVGSDVGAGGLTLEELRGVRGVDISDGAPVLPAFDDMPTEAPATGTETGSEPEGETDPKSESEPEPDSGTEPEPEPEPTP